MTDVKSVAVDFDPFAAGEIALTAPITSPQREIWSAIQVGGDGANRAYNEGLAVVMRGSLDVAALERSLDKLVQRHEALRTTFSVDGSKLLVAPSAHIPLSQRDLRGEADPVGAYQRFERTEADAPFDLERGPLARVSLLRIADDEWRLLLLLHHIVCDGWSFGVLMGELGKLYNAELHASAADLPAPESFVAYAEERARNEQSADARRSLAFWVEQFADGVPELDLPLDRARPPLRTYRAERIEYEIGAELVEAVRAAARQQNASLLQLLLTSFQTLLARLSGQWDLVTGISAAGQASSGRYGLVGHAVSFLPIRARLDAQGSFADALARTKRMLGDALEHQDVTFGTLLENLVIARDPSRVPLAPINFNVDQALPGTGFEGLELFASNVARTHEAFEIFINLVDRKRTFVIEAQYNADLYSAETLRDWLESYETLLRAVVRAPNNELGKLPLLGEAARERVLMRWNDTATQFEPTTLHALFERSADAAPTRDALIFEQERLGYAELEKRANRLAHHLRKQGVGPEQIVGVCVRRSVDMVVAQLAILKAGGAYLPLDPSYPAERLAYMLEDAGARVVISRSDSVEALGTLPSGLRSVLLDREQAEITREPDTRPEGGARGENIAYVIYTSGSTGKPKGVLVEHRNFANFLVGMDQRLTLSPPGVWLFATSIGFDISLLELFGSLARGFTVVLHSDESGPEHGLAQLIERHGVTHFQCTPSQATILVGDEAGRSALSRLRELLLGGEALPIDLARKLIHELKSGRLVNMYGPTETTIWSTTHVVSADDAAVSIGRPIANTRLYVLDARGEPVARGAIGELYIGGAGVTRGYHHRPELTRERFVADPFAGADARMYKTGDLARFRSDGTVDFLGRNDHQVKIRGYRIELGEIEVALRAHPAVADVVVIAREDRPGDKRLVAYLVCAAGKDEPTVQMLKSHLGERGLPEYMLPQAFVTLAKLPTTPNGKLDRRALPAPEQESSLSAGSYVAPRTESERALANLWQEVLGVGRASVTNNFFDLGGHSLLAVRLVSTIRERLGVNVPIARVFQSPTIEQLAAFLDASALSSGAASSSDGRVEIEL
jgi:amino acid adenylation domain-containing protein